MIQKNDLSHQIEEVAERLKNLRILAVEPDARDRFQLMMLMRRHGISTRSVCAYPEQALYWIQTGLPYDVLVCDERFAADMRRILNPSHLIVSSSSGLSQVCDLYALGAERVIKKPYLEREFQRLLWYLGSDATLRAQHDFTDCETIRRGTLARLKWAN